MLGPPSQFFIPREISRSFLLANPVWRSKLEKVAILLERKGSGDAFDIVDRKFVISGIEVAPSVVATIWVISSEPLVARKGEFVSHRIRRVMREGEGFNTIIVNGLNSFFWSEYIRSVSLLQ